MPFYEDFSRVYDQVMDQELYDQWLDFTERHLPFNSEVGQATHDVTESSAQSKSIFELACGSGALSVRLAQKGYQVFGLDISEEMLTLANQKAHDTGVKVEFVAGDMRDLSGIGQFDAVTCYSDSICYMADLSEVQQVFKEVASVLLAGGVFIFDVHSTHQIDDVFPGTSYHENEEDFAFLWDSFEGDLGHSIVHELTFFVKDSDGKFIRKDEVHQERTYPIDEYLSALSKYFTEVKVYADFTDSAPNDESYRWFFVCTK